jgi:hypothetical protein
MDSELRSSCFICMVQSEIRQGVVEDVLQILTGLVRALRTRVNRQKTEAQYENRLERCLTQSHSPY